MKEQVEGKTEIHVKDEGRTKLLFHPDDAYIILQQPDIYVSA